MKDLIKDQNVEMLQMFEGLTPPDIRDIEDPSDFRQYLSVAIYQLNTLEAQAEHIAFKVQFTKALITHFERCIRGLQSAEHEG